MRILIFLCLAAALGACANQSNDYCTTRLSGNLDMAMRDAGERLGNGCEYQFDSYFQQLLTVAEANPDRNNRVRFSDFPHGSSPWQAAPAW